MSTSTTCQDDGCTIWNGNVSQNEVPEDGSTCQACVDTTQEIRDYLNTYGVLPKGFISRGGDILGDGKQARYNVYTGQVPGSYTDDGHTYLVPTGGDGSAAAVRIASDSIYDGTPINSPDDIGVHINGIINSTIGDIAIVVPAGQWPQKTQIARPEPTQALGENQRRVHIIGEGSKVSVINATQAMTSQIFDKMPDDPSWMTSAFMLPTQVHLQGLTLNGNNLVTYNLQTEGARRGFFIDLDLIDATEANWRICDDKYSGTQVRLVACKVDSVFCNSTGDPGSKADYGIWATRFWDAKVYNVWVYHWDVAAIYLYKAGGQSHWDTCHLVDSVPGFVLVGSSYICISNCEFDFTTVGIDCDEDSDGVRIVDNVFFQNTDIGSGGNDDSRIGVKLQGQKMRTLIAHNAFHRIAVDIDHIDGPTQGAILGGSTFIGNNIHPYRRQAPNSIYEWHDDVRCLERGKVEFSNGLPDNNWYNYDLDMFLRLTGQDLFGDTAGYAFETKMVGIELGRWIQATSERQLRWQVRMSGGETGVSEQSTFQVVRHSKTDGSQKDIPFRISSDDGGVTVKSGLVVDGAVEGATSSSQNVVIRIQDSDTSLGGGAGQDFPALRVMLDSDSITRMSVNKDGTMSFRGYVPDVAGDGTVTLKRDSTTADGTTAVAIQSSDGTVLATINYRGEITSPTIDAINARLDALENP